MSTVYGNCATFEPSDKLANVYGLGVGTFCLLIKLANINTDFGREQVYTESGRYVLFMDVFFYLLCYVFVLFVCLFPMHKYIYSRHILIVGNEKLIFHIHLISLHFLLLEFMLVQVCFCLPLLVFGFHCFKVVLCLYIKGDPPPSKCHP